MLESKKTRRASSAPEIVPLRIEFAKVGVRFIYRLGQGTSPGVVVRIFHNVPPAVM